MDDGRTWRSGTIRTGAFKPTMAQRVLVWSAGVNSVFESTGAQTPWILHALRFLIRAICGSRSSLAQPKRIATRFANPAKLRLCYICRAHYISVWSRCALFSAPTLDVICVIREKKFGFRQFEKSKLDVKFPSDIAIGHMIEAAYVVLASGAVISTRALSAS